MTTDLYGRGEKQQPLSHPNLSLIVDENEEFVDNEPLNITIAHDGTYSIPFNVNNVNNNVKIFLRFPCLSSSLRFGFQSIRKKKKKSLKN